MSEFVGEQEERSETDALMWEYLEQEEYDYQAPETGEVLTGVVMDKHENEILVDLGLKREAVVPDQDLERLSQEEIDAIQEGEDIEVYVMPKEDIEGRRLVSVNMALMQKDWERAEELMETSDIVEAEIINYNKGGALVPFGRLRGFVPASQLTSLSSRGEGGSYQERLASLVGEKVKLKVIEVNPRRRRLIFSERAAVREWRQEQKEKLLDELEPGDVRKGVVTNLQPFGAFVDLGGADGLIHVSELAWHRVKHPRDVLDVGEEVEVYILNVDEDRERIGLSLKRLQPDPWTQVESKYSVGDIVEVEITNLTDFGAFARLEDGIEGLIHISELAYGPVQHPREIVERGEIVQVQVVSIDVDRQRIGLSLKRATAELAEQRQAEAVAQVGQDDVEEEDAGDEKVDTVAEAAAGTDTEEETDEVAEATKEADVESAVDDEETEEAVVAEDENVEASEATDETLEAAADVEASEEPVEEELEPETVPENA